jgi:probable HAF family extracellular repeat protein
MHDLGTLGGTSSWAGNVNASGQIVGWAYTSSGNQHAFLDSGGVMTDLGTLGGSASIAWGINASGQVMGDADTSSGIQHAFLYSDGSMTDLNSLIFPNPGWTLSEATCINDLGQIAGYETNSSGQTHACLLTPIPEPSTLVLFGIGAISLLAYAWRRTA